MQGGVPGHLCINNNTILQKLSCSSSKCSVAILFFLRGASLTPFFKHKKKLLFSAVVSGSLSKKTPSAVICRNFFFCARGFFFCARGFIDLFPHPKSVILSRLTRKCGFLHERTKLTNKMNAGYLYSYIAYRSPWCVSSAVAARERSTQRSRVRDSRCAMQSVFFVLFCFSKPFP